MRRKRVSRRRRPVKQTASPNIMIFDDPFASTFPKYVTTASEPERRKQYSTKRYIK